MDFGRASCSHVLPTWDGPVLQPQVINAVQHRCLDGWHCRDGQAAGQTSGGVAVAAQQAVGGCTAAAAMCGLLSTCVAAAAELGWQRDGNKRRRQKPWPTKGWRSVCGCAMRAPGTACETRQAMVPAAAAVFATAARSESVQRRSTCLRWRCPHPPVHRFTELLII